MKRALTRKTLYRGVSACALIAVCAGAGVATSGARADEIEAAGPSNTVQEIIITAERRNESAQDVPMTVQAFSGQTLQDNNIQTLDDLLKMTPNVTFANNGPGQGNIYMRGLGAGMAGNQSSATIGNFPNTAIYLDDQSMQFPSRNVDIYMVDMERVEVLEGPQGTLFGGGAEAGALRYITNKPKMNTWEARAEGSYGFTDGGANNNGENAMINIPLIKDRLAARIVLYNDRQGGYIDNAPSTFTRSNQDLGNYYFGVKPGTNGLCPNGKAPGSTGCTLPGAPVANNYQLAQNDQNPVTNQGARISVLGQITDDWSMLVTETISDLDAEGLSVEYPTGSDFQQLKPMQVTSFTPSYDHDRYTNTAWTLTGDIDGWKAVYTGGFTSRHIDQQMDYTNYSRTGGGIYYQCTGGSGGLFGASSGTPTCYSPVGYWHDTVKNTHLTEEARVSTPDNWRIRGIGGWYWEQFRIDDVMNFNYKTIPDCTDANLAAAQAGGATCLADVRTAPGSTANDPGIRGANTAFGEDVQRGYDQNAFFGSVDFDVIPDVLTVTGGTRWYRYSEFELGSQYGTGSSCVNVPNGQCSGSMVNIDQAGDHKVYSGTRSRANITWKIQPDILGYFTFSQGFRPGGFNRSVSNVAPLANKSEYQYTKPNSYAPDSLTNYEVGVKSELFDRRLQLNLSGYYMDWKNVQMNFYNPTALGNTSFGVNGPDYNIKGLEAQFIAKPLEGWTLQGSGSYNDATQTTSPCLFGNVAGSASQGKCITQVYEAGVGVVSFQNPFGAVGTPPAFSPRIQGNMQLRYDWKVEDYKMFATVSGNYTGSMYNQLATYPSGENVAIPQTTLLRYLQPSYETMDASINLIHDNYQIGLFGTNLTNSQASMFTSSTQFIKSEVPIRPRVIGLKLSATF